MKIIKYYYDNQTKTTTNMMNKKMMLIKDRGKGKNIHNSWAVTNFSIFCMNFGVTKIGNCGFGHIYWKILNGILKGFFLKHWWSSNQGSLSSTIKPTLIKYKSRINN